MDKVGTKYCILENDGVGLCVCKHRPCEQLQRAKVENKELSESIKRLKNMAKAAALGREKYKYALQKLEQENERLKARLRPLEDSYFNGLSSIQITELAKKSIRITAENRKLEYALQEIRDFLELPEFYIYGKEVIHDRILAKINEVIGGE